MPSIIRKTIGKYKIESLIGKGGMGSVYLARDLKLDRLVAIKVLSGDYDDEELRNRFQQEASLASQLSHPNIVTIFDFKDSEPEIDGRPYIAMEYVRGELLEELINRRADMQVQRLLEIIDHVCAGAAHAHDHGVVHRDIKPANIMVEESGLVKILDFGIARSRGSNITAPGQVLGTPSYMSPEQAQGLEVDCRSDVFSIGVVSYELLAGRQAFRDARQSVYGDRIPLEEHCPHIHPNICRIIDKAMMKDASDRYQDLQHMRTDIARAREVVRAGTIPVTEVDAPAAPVSTSVISNRAAEDREADECVREAHALLESGKLTAADTLLAQALKMRPSLESAVELQRRLRQERREQERARDHALRVQIALSSARTYRDKGAFPAAVRFANEALSYDANLTEALEIKDDAARRLKEIDHGVFVGPSPAPPTIKDEAWPPEEFSSRKADSVAERDGRRRRWQQLGGYLRQRDEMLRRFLRRLDDRGRHRLDLHRQSLQRLRHQLRQRLDSLGQGVARWRADVETPAAQSLDLPKRAWVPLLIVVFLLVVGLAIALTRTRKTVPVPTPFTLELRSRMLPSEFTVPLVGVSGLVPWFLLIEQEFLQQYELASTFARDARWAEALTAAEAAANLLPGDGRIVRLLESMTADARRTASNARGVAVNERAQELALKDYNDADNQFERGRRQSAAREFPDAISSFHKAEDLFRQATDKANRSKSVPTIEPIAVPPLPSTPLAPRLTEAERLQEEMVGIAATLKTIEDALRRKDSTRLTDVWRTHDFQTKLSNPYLRSATVTRSGSPDINQQTLRATIVCEIDFTFEEQRRFRPDRKWTEHVKHTLTLEKRGTVWVVVGTTP